MASGNSLIGWTPLGNEPPATNYATLDSRNAHLTLDFDAATNESAVFSGILPRHYGGGGLTITLVWLATTATSGNVILNTQIERVDTATDTDADSFATAVASAATATSATSGAPIYTDIAHTSGAQMDSLAAGEAFRLKVTRDAAAGGDTMTGDLELIAVTIRET